MGNATRIGFLGTLAVALGIGFAFVSAPTVAASPGDSDAGSASNDSASSDSSAKKDTSAASDNAPKPRRRAFDKSDESASDKGDTPRRRGGDSSRTEPKSTPNSQKDDDDDAPPSSRESGASETTAPDSTKTDLAAADPVPPVVPSAPAEPVRTAGLVSGTSVTFAGRDLEQATSRRSAAENPQAGEVGNTLVADEDVEPALEEVTATEPGFVSSTRGFFGLFSITSAGDPEDDNYVAVVFRTPIFTFVLTSGTDPEDNLGLGEASIGRDGHTVGTFLSPFLNFSLAIPVEDPFAGLFIALIRAGIV